MADNTDLNPGTAGDKVVTREITHAGDTAKLQGVFAMGISGSEGSYTAEAVGGDAANGLDVDVTRLPPVTNAGTFAVQAAQSGTWNVTNVSGTVSLPTGAATAANQTTIIGHVDGIEGLLTTIDADTSALAGAVAGTEVQVDVVTLPAIPAGTNNIGDVDIASIAAGDNNIGNVDVVSLPALPAGTNAIGTVTAVGAAAEDAAASGNPVLVGGRYDSSPRTLETGDAGAIALNASGQVLVEIAAGAGSGGTSAADDADFTAGTTSGTPVMGVYESTPTTVTDGDLGTVGITSGRALKVAISSGGIAGIAEDSAAAGGEEGIMMLAVRRDAASSGVSADGDFAALSVDSNGALRVVGSSGTTQYAEDAAHVSGDQLCIAGAVRRDTAAVGSGTDGDYSTLNVNASGRLYTSTTIDAALPAGTNNIGDVDVLTLPNVTLAAGTNTNEVVGDAAHDAAIAGNPIRLAGRALTSDYTAVAAGDTADLITTLLGKLVTIPYANPANTWSYAAASGGITNTTAVTVKAAAGAGVRNYVTSLDVVNGHATVDTEVLIRDGAAGTVLWRGFAKAAGGGVSRKFEPPLRGTANTLLEVVNGTTGSATYFNLSGFVAAE